MSNGQLRPLGQGPFLVDANNKIKGVANPDGTETLFGFSDDPDGKTDLNFVTSNVDPVTGVIEFLGPDGFSAPLSRQLNAIGGLPAGHQQSSSTLSTISATSQMVREWFVPQAGCSFIQITYDNALSSGDIVVSAALEWPAGTYTALKFEDGGASATIKPGAIARTRIAQFYHPGTSSSPTASDAAYIRTYISAAGGQIPSRGAADFTSVLIAGVGDKWSNGGGDQTTTNDSGLTAANGYIYSPLAISCGGVAYAGRVFGGLGDSLCNGQGDAPLTLGWMQRAIFPTRVPYIRDGRPGKSTGDFTAPAASAFEGVARISGCTDVCIQLGTNDVSNGSTFTALKTNYEKLILMLRKMGVSRIYVATIPPRTTSTDSWATTANQTTNGAGFAAGNGSVRGQFNAWLRARPDGVFDVIDVAAVCESATDSGIWNPGLTADGIHPNSAACAAIASSANFRI